MPRCLGIAPRADLPYAGKGSAATVTCWPVYLRGAVCSKAHRTRTRTRRKRTARQWALDLTGIHEPGDDKAGCARADRRAYRGARRPRAAAAELAYGARAARADIVRTGRVMTAATRAKIAATRKARSTRSKPARTSGSCAQAPRAAQSAACACLGHKLEAAIFGSRL